MIKKWLFLSSLCGLLACGVQNVPPPSEEALDIEDQPARVVVVVATRGSYQYLLEMEGDGYGPGQRYWPLEMSEDFQTDGLRVRFDGKLTGDSVWVMRPGPTDIPEPDYRVPEVRVRRMDKN